MAKGDVREGELHGGLPYLSIGTGPPHLVLSGLTSTNANPKGFNRRITLGLAGSLPEQRTVYFVNRRPGLAEGTTMTDLAGDHAAAIEHEFGEAVTVQGISTGGSVALQLAVEHPAVVRKVIAHGSACTLSDTARQVQREVARLVAAGRWRPAFGAIASISARTSLTRALQHGLGWLLGPIGAPDDATDMVRTIEAEDDFDVCDRLHLMTAPLLVVGGERDGFYGPELFRRTADGAQDGSLVLLPKKGHVGSIGDKGGQRAIADFVTG